MSQTDKKTNFYRIGNKVMSMMLGMLILCFLFPQQAKADAAIPTLILIWPVSWILLLAIIPIEYFVAKKVLSLNNKNSFLVSLIANAISSLAGIPIAWIITAVSAFLLYLPTIYKISTTHTVSVNNMPEWLNAIISVAAYTIVLAPSSFFIENEFHKNLWALPIMIVVLLLPYFLASVWIEKLVAQRFIQDKHMASKWSWTANSISYGLILFGLLCFLLPRAIHDSSFTLIEGISDHSSGVDIYAFSKEQVDATIAQETVNGKNPEVRDFFDKLPFQNPVAYTKSGPGGVAFSMLLPKHGKFIIAAKIEGIHLEPGNGRTSGIGFSGAPGYLTFWLVPVEPNGENTIKFELDNHNNIDAKTPIKDWQI